MQGLIDTHFHLDMYKNYNEIYKIIIGKKQYTLCMTNSPGVFLSCKNIFGDNKYIKFALGFHPLNMDLKEKDLRDFMKMLPQTEYVGEIGLDFTKKTGIEKNKQIKWFEKIVEACSEKNKVMSIHIRGAEEIALKILSKYCPRRCILHWYTGNVELQKDFIHLGCYFSVNASMVKNMDVVNAIPKDRLLIESDGPYSKVNGKKFSPSLLLEEYELIAKSLDEPELIRVVFDNFKNLLLTK